jgi:hypothetical protein
VFNHARAVRQLTCQGYKVEARVLGCLFTEFDSCLCNLTRKRHRHSLGKVSGITKYRLAAAK